MRLAARASCLFVVVAIAIAIAIATASAPALAGTMADPICTDRPGKGSATCTVPKGHLQVESGLAGWSLTETAGSRQEVLKLGETAFKYGLTDHLHIELAFTPLTLKRVRDDDGRTRDSGFGDVELRVKQELAGSGPLAAALYPYVKLPTASKRIGNGKVEGGLIVPLSLALGDTPWSIAASPKLSLAADGDGHGYHAAMAQNLALGVQATDALSLSAELWGSWDWDGGGTTREASVGASAAFRITEEWQIDGGADWGLNRSTADVEIYGGVSARF